MNKSGRYIFIEGEGVVKVSDEIPKIASRIDGVYFRQPYVEYFNGKEPCLITSKEHKKQEMARRGIREYDPLPEERWRRPRQYFTKEGKRTSKYHDSDSPVFNKMLETSPELQKSFRKYSQP